MMTGATIGVGAGGVSAGGAGASFFSTVLVAVLAGTESDKCDWKE